VVLAGGRGSRLYQLTDRRVKPSVYFGGKVRLVDSCCPTA
jgi:glucose-1-phosphate adenylyltransferase